MIFETVITTKLQVITRVCSTYRNIPYRSSVPTVGRGRSAINQRRVQVGINLRHGQ